MSSSSLLLAKGVTLPKWKLFAMRGLSHGDQELCQVPTGFLGRGVYRADLRAMDRPVSFAHADRGPYPGNAGDYPPSTEVHHASLLERLLAGGWDGWALSTAGVVPK
jgi:hypothetical protein